jgi:proteasome lid subunit RPN8/RPN11
LAAWSAPQCRFGVEYSPRVLDDIRLAVVDAFFLAPRGGVEVGGILLGDFEGKRLRITGYAPIECEHALGPSFTLSDHDRGRLAEMLGRRVVLPGRRVVGWYHSHTRSEILFSSADEEIHQRFFPEAWQTALVLRPHTFKPTRAGFFFREEDGSIHGEASYKEFVLTPLPPRPEEMEEPASVEAPVPAVEAPAPAAETPKIIALPFLEAYGKPSRRWRGALLVVVACLAAVSLAYETRAILLLQADLKVQTERATRAEKSLAEARAQLETEREKNAAPADEGK